MTDTVAKRGRKREFVRISVTAGVKALDLFEKNGNKIASLNPKGAAAFYDMAAEIAAAMNDYANMTRLEKLSDAARDAADAKESAKVAATLGFGPAVATVETGATASV